MSLLDITGRSVINHLVIIYSKPKIDRINMDFKRLFTKDNLLKVESLTSTDFFVAKSNWLTFKLAG